MYLLDEEILHQVDNYSPTEKIKLFERSMVAQQKLSRWRRWYLAASNFKIGGPSLAAGRLKTSQGFINVFCDIKNILVSSSV